MNYFLTSGTSSRRVYEVEERLGNIINIIGSLYVLRNLLIFMEGLPSATWIFLVSAHGNLMGRVPFFVAEDMGHRVRVHNLLCPALHHCCPSSRVLTHPICWGPHLAEELSEAGKDWAEGRSGSLSCHAWPRGPPRCRPGPTESEELRTASAFLPARTDRRISEPLEQQDGKGRPLRSEGRWYEGRNRQSSQFPLC